MLPLSKVASKVVLAPALVAADVALERVLKAMTSHVDSVKNVVREVDVTVLAVMQHVRVLQRSGQARSWSARLAVGNARGAVVPTVLTTRHSYWTAVAVRRGSGLWSDGGGG